MKKAKTQFRRVGRSATIPLDGVPTIPQDLHQRLSLGDDAEGLHLEVNQVALAAREIRRRQLAKLSGQADIELPEEMPRYA